MNLARLTISGSYLFVNQYRTISYYLIHIFIILKLLNILPIYEDVFVCAQFSPSDVNNHLLY